MLAPNASGERLGKRASFFPVRSTVLFGLLSSCHSRATGKNCCGRPQPACLFIEQFLGRPLHRLPTALPRCKKDCSFRKRESMAKKFLKGKGRLMLVRLVEF
jgi:hypothetical protein